jgi:hypothetical protein
MIPERLDECLSIIRWSPERTAASFIVALKPLTIWPGFPETTGLYPQA